MNNTMTSVVTIRQRGQLTIPDKVREAVQWLTPGSVVTFTASEEEVRVVPYRKKKEEVDWKRIWDDIHVVRSFNGERGNLSAFITKDRQSH